MDPSAHVNQYAWANRPELSIASNASLSVGGPASWTRFVDPLRGPASRTRFVDPLRGPASWTNASVATSDKFRSSSFVVALRRAGVPAMRIIRYADDFVVLVNGQRADAETLWGEVTEVLAPAGLSLSPEKTRVCHIDDGFDFLGDTFSAAAGVVELAGKSCTLTHQRRR